MKTLYGISLIILAIGTSGCGVDQLSPKGYPDELGVCPTIGWSNSAAVVLEGPGRRGYRPPNTARPDGRQAERAGRLGCGYRWTSPRVRAGE